MRFDLVVVSARRLAWLIVLAVVGAAAAFAAESDFPFDQELLLDAPPMQGSDRLPGIEVQSDGMVAIDLWCTSARARVRVDGSAISIVPYRVIPAQCPPERLQRDADLLDALSQVTTWRREGDAVVLVGPQVLRYRPSSH
jgi:hypothetical protein